VRKIENYPTSSEDRPTSRIEVPDDADQDVQNPEVALGIAKEIREIGNKLFKEGKVKNALDKYQSKYTFDDHSQTVLSKHSESIRYLDLHHELPDDSTPELKASFNSLLAPLLLNSALTAIRSQPPSHEIAVECATRALNDLKLSNDDKGKGNFHVLLTVFTQNFNPFSKSTIPSRLGPSHPERRKRSGARSLRSKSTCP
jgi:peptidyl-prolyl isomerase D